MPPRIYSRHTFCTGFRDVAGPLTESDKLQLTEREIYEFRNLPDNLAHTVLEGENLFNLASRYFDGFSDNPAQLWWVIADFQPDPIIDPTIALRPGSTVIIPSTRTLHEIFKETRRPKGEP